MCGKKSVRIEPCAVETLEHVLAVAGRSRPIHQLMGAVRAAVYTVNAPLLRQQSGQRQIFLRGHIPRQRRDDAIPRRFRRVAVGGIEGIGVDESQVEVVQQPLVGVVRVQADQTAVDHAGVAPSAVLEIPADEAAHILDRIALALGQCGVLRRRLPSAGGLRKFVQQFTPQHLSVLPLRCLSAPANGDQELAVVLYLHEFFLLR